MRFGLVILATCHFQDTGQLGFYIFWHPLAYQGPSLSAISARRWLVLLEECTVPAPVRGLLGGNPRREVPTKSPLAHRKAVSTETRLPIAGSFP